MLNQRLEGQYKNMKLQTSMSNFQIIYSLSFLLFFIWELVNVLDVGFETEGIDIARYSILGVFLCSLIWSFTRNFMFNYYRWAPVFLLIGVAAMMVMSWFTEDLNISLTSALVIVITTFYFNLLFINTLIINVINPLNFLVRILYLYYYKNWDEEKGEKEDLLQFYSIATYFILLSFITIYSMYIIYRTEKQKRADFISKDQI